MKLIFASHNQNKCKEIAVLLDGLIQVHSLADIGYFEEIIENGYTLEENAFIKANAIHSTCSISCFADDTGLLVESLNGAPGVYSARYAGIEKDSTANMNKLLEEMESIENRSAKFVTIICLIFQNETHYFEGVLQGTIAKTKIGSNGFGYDPIFIPEGSNKTLAEMTLSEKSEISHRAIAFHKMKAFFQTQLGSR